MIQLILARTVSSLCNCVTYFSGNSRSSGPNFHYRGFNKTRNDQTEYEIDSLLMEDDLVDELVATPLSAEEIAAKLSNSNTKHNPNSILGGKDVKMDNSIGARGTDIWMGASSSSLGIGTGSGGGMRIERNENKISNDWWSDGEEDDDEDEYGYNSNNNNNNINKFSASGGSEGMLVNPNEANEKIINTSFFNTNTGVTGVNSMNNNGVITSNQLNSFEEDLYFDKNLEEIDFQGNDSNNNQLQSDNWDKEFFENYKDEETFDFVPIKENIDHFGIGNDLKIDHQADKDRINNNDFGDFGDFTSGNSPNSNNINNYTKDEYFESKMVVNLENEGDSFDQETDDYQNSNQMTTCLDQNVIIANENIVDDFYNQCENSDHNEFDYNGNFNQSTISNSVVNLKKEPEFGIDTCNRGNILEDFDDIFNSSFKSNDHFDSEKKIPQNHGITSTCDHQNNDFEIFDFVSAKSPPSPLPLPQSLPADHHFNSDFSDQISNSHQKSSILLDY